MAINPPHRDRNRPAHAVRQIKYKLLHVIFRRRGEILLSRDPRNSVPAEEAFRSAIAVAKKQGARSYELVASLALAKRYQSTGRPTEAHAVLAPSLEGFSPTPELPQIAEAQALLAEISLLHGP